MSATRVVACFSFAEAFALERSAARHDTPENYRKPRQTVGKRMILGTRALDIETHQCIRVHLLLHCPDFAASGGYVVTVDDILNIAMPKDRNTVTGVGKG